MNYEKLILSVLPTLITAFVSIIAMVTSYQASKNAQKQSYNNNVDSMRFTQKEKVADQIAEKAAMLLTKCDPNVLNTVINEIVPRPISHEENANIRRYLLGIADEIQTYSNVLKMLSYSIFDSDEMLAKLEGVWNALDTVEQKCSEMLLRLVEIYTAMTSEGNIKGINVMEEKMRLERSFSEGYSRVYCQLHGLISDLVWYIRQQSIPNHQKRKGKKRRSLKEKSMRKI